MPIEQFRNAMQAAGIEPPAYICGDGQIHRFYIKGDKSGTLNGAYQLHLNGKSNGWFEDWRGLKVKWTSSDKSQSFTKEMRKQLEENRRQKAIEEQLRHEQSAFNAQFIWSKSSAVITHPYLERKRVKPHNTRLYRDSLVIPIYSEFRELVNLQFIQCDGSKRFLSGGRKKGCFSVIKSTTGNTDIVLICEGWATGGSLSEHTGHQVVIALDAGNLSITATAIRNIYPKAEIVICGDNDLSGIGQRAARDAAVACGGTYKIPAHVGSDWNDALAGGVVNG
jgi:putative DNA primase/helicase